jgi:hypothetical protein
MGEMNCPICPNHCSKDHLACPRGKNYFSKESNEQVDNDVIKDLRKCGHMLHHNRNLDVNEILSKFSNEELETLHLLLKRIYE